MTHLTEEQAKTRWCPFSRLVPVKIDGDKCTLTGTMPAGYNRGSIADRPGMAHLPDASYCIASACMAWRFARKPNPDWKPEGYTMMAVYPRPDTRFDPPMYVEDTTRGFCGLAGKPDPA